MKNPILSLVLLLWGLCTCMTQASAKRTVIDDQRTFHLSFFDTSYVYDITLALHYDDSVSQKYELTIKGDSILKTVKIQLTDSLDYRELERKLNKIALEKDINHTITQFSVFEVFYWVFTTVNGTPTRPLAGVINIATEVKYFVDNEDNGMDYRRRIFIADSIVDKLNYYQARVRWLEDKKNSLLVKETDAIKLDNELQDKTSYQKSLTTIYSALKELSDDMDRLVSYQTNVSIEEPEVKKLITQVHDKSEGLKKEISKINDSRLSQLLGDWTSFTSNTDYSSITQKKFKLDSFKSNNKIKDNVAGLKVLVGSLDTERTNVDAQVAALTKKKDDAESFKNIPEAINQLNNTIRVIGQDMKGAHIATISRVDIQIERGFIENIKVIMAVDGRETIFENSYAIGFTSKSNYRALAFTKLFARLGEKTMHIWLSDVLRNYDNEIDLYTRDYSPADTLIKINPSANPRVNVYKAQFVNLFDTKFFTDLNGLANNQPNGLVQFELARKLNIFTERNQIKNEVNYGFVNYLYVFGALNKIENNQRYLPLRNANVVVNNTLVSPSYATTLDFLQYRNLTAGAELNLFLYDAPSWKNTVTLDFGAQYGHTPLLDSSRRVDASGALIAAPDSLRLNANLLTLYPKLMIELFPERRLGLSFAYELMYTRIFSNNGFKQIKSYAKSDASVLPIEPSARFSHMFEVFLKVELNKETSSKLFLRGRFYWQQGDVNTYFPQLQLGYSYYLKLPKLEK